jgi:hypothetical protein
MIVFIFILWIFLLWFLISSEIGSQDCRTNKCNNKVPEACDCKNLSDSIFSLSLILSKIWTDVNWRRSAIITLLLAPFFVFWFRNFSPKTFFRDLFFVLLVLLLLIYFLSVILSNIHFRPLSTEIDSEINSLFYFFSSDEKNDKKII